MSRSSQWIGKFILSFCLILVFSADSRATHNRAGEITYEQIDELTIRATITTYTKTSSFAADRDSVEMIWGDGTREFVQRSNDQGTAIENDVKINYYIAEHTYPSRGTYTMGMLDPNRIAGILNIDFPNSVNITFYIQTTFSLLNTQFQGNNSSVVLLQPPIDFACVGVPFVHNPNAFDPDGDSISYEFDVPFQDVDQEVPNYLFPDEISPGPENMLTLDPVTGEIRWESPQAQGEVNLTIRINEYRSGVLINSLVRDMQITVTSCMEDPTPPDVAVVEEICVIAGEKIDLEVIVDDVDEGEQVIVEATGGPFILDISPGTFNAPDVYRDAPITGRFEWQTTCEHVREEPYQVVFRGVDDLTDQFGNTQGLATLKTLKIFVVAPPPLDPAAEVENQAVTLTWEAPYLCEESEKDLFRGFSVWRRNNSQQVPIDSCKGGLEGFGYEKIVFLTDEKLDGRYFITDTDLDGQGIYCYRILAEFAPLSAAGNAFNIVESIPSEEVCVEYLRDRPLLTKVSVLDTDAAQGAIQIDWIPPLAEDLDTIANPGPYRYNLMHSSNGAIFTEIASFPFTNILDPGISSFIHENVNTADTQHEYRMDFAVNGSDETFTMSPAASSVYLSLVASDKRISLSWDADVPWSNFEYYILKENDSAVFDTIASVDAFPYTDFEVENGIEYCYKVVTKGEYRIARVPDVLINDSQIACAFPLDTLPPCTVELRVSNLCDNPSALSATDRFENALTWSTNECADDSDITNYNVYYAENENSPFQLIETLNNSSSNYVHSPATGISGCYVVTALDILGNESEFSNVICLDNCPQYELPNTFTPNADGANDRFVPRVNRFIASIDMKIYNQWGQIVFETSDPSIGWDGTNKSGKELAEGAYYYTTVVIENRLSGDFEQEKVRTGYINLIR